MKLRKDYNYSGKNFLLTPYDTNQEKDLLLQPAIGKPDLTSALEICGMQRDDIDNLTDDEKISMLYQYREISVGDELNLKFTCKNCAQPNENKLSISDIVTSSDIKNPEITDQFKVVTEDNIQDFCKQDIDELDIDDFENLYSDIRNTVTKFDFMKPISCQSCSAINHIKIDDHKFVIENMSEDSLMSLYQTYNDMNFYGKYSKLDIDSMYPFERTILLGLLLKTREDLNNG